MHVTLVVNPRARASRKNPRVLARLEEALGGAGEVLRVGEDDLGQAFARQASAPPDVVAIHGGDGTLHGVVSHLVPAFAGRPLPPLALLGGGTMNVVPRSLGLRAEPLGFLRALVRAPGPARDWPARPHPALRVGQRHGFVFANGAFASFLRAYYEDGDYGPLRAVWLATRMTVSRMLGGALARRVFRPFEGGVEIDGVTLPARRHVTISAATVSQAGMGFRLHPAASTVPGRFSVLAATGYPTLRDIVAVRLGREMSRRRSTRHQAERVWLHPPPGQAMLYTLDGEMYESAGPLELSLGPELSLLRPR